MRRFRITPPCLLVAARRGTLPRRASPGPRADRLSAADGGGTLSPSSFRASHGEGRPEARPSPILGWKPWFSELARARLLERRRLRRVGRRVNEVRPVRERPVRALRAGERLLRLLLELLVFLNVALLLRLLRLLQDLLVLEGLADLGQLGSLDHDARRDSAPRRDRHRDMYDLAVRAAKRRIPNLAREHDRDVGGEYVDEEPRVAGLRGPVEQQCGALRGDAERNCQTRPDQG